VSGSAVFAIVFALCQVTVIMAVLSGINLAVSPFLNLALSGLIIANLPLHCLNFSRSPGNKIRADFFFRLGAGPLNLSA
jgi:hypothetical protein